MKKRIFGLIGAIAIIALMVFNTQVTTNSNRSSFTLSSLVMQAFADGEVATCLGNYIYEGSKAPVNSKKCYSDAPGPDIFNGYVVTCPNGGQGCQPSFCTSSEGCYTTGI